MPKKVKKAAKKTVKKAVKKTPKKAVRTIIKKVVKKVVVKPTGPQLTCGVCGYRVIVDETCGCTEEHVLVCCGQPMTKSQPA